jgi:hypothetical protein
MKKNYYHPKKLKLYQDYFIIFIGSELLYFLLYIKLFEVIPLLNLDYFEFYFFYPELYKVLLMLVNIFINKFFIIF